MPVSPHPFYEHADVGEQGRRRLLLLSYHFPPSGAIGARRWEKLVHSAAERGWGVDVIQHRDPAAPLTAADQARLAKLPSGVRLYAVPLRPFRIQRAEGALARWTRGLRRGAAPAPAPAAGGPAAAPAAPVVSAAAEEGAATRASLRWRLQTPGGLLRAYWA